jgi:hypothetical protein
MTTTIIGIILIVGLVLTAAVFLRWHTVPLEIAHRIRRRAGHGLAGRRAREAGQEFDPARP